MCQGLWVASDSGGRRSTCNMVDSSWRQMSGDHPKSRQPWPINHVYPFCSFTLLVVTCRTSSYVRPYAHTHPIDVWRSTAEQAGPFSSASQITYPRPKAPGCWNATSKACIRADLGGIKVWRCSCPLLVQHPVLTLPTINSSNAIKCV